MTDRIKESISALMDGEADELELRRVLAEDKETVNSTWQNYHLIRSVLTKRTVPRQTSLASRVSQAIADENLSHDQPAKRSSWVKSISSVAIAASVAFAVVFSVRAINPVDGTSVLPVQSATPVLAGRVYLIDQGGPLNASFGNAKINNAQRVTPVILAEPANNDVQSDAEIKNRFDKYILRHTERAALNNGQGMMSFARVANFEVTDQ